MTYQEFQKRYKYNPAKDNIGKGGFGTVFKAYDNYLDNYVAIKMSAVTDENDTTRLANEVKLANKLPTHPNIAHYEACYTFSTPVGVYDFGVLKYYEDGNLEELQKQNVLSEADKISILKQILNGIGFLHKNRVVHRDLKPRNILIARREGKIIPKITDFGISKEFEEGHSTAFGNSMTGAGTLAYSSPEQLNDKVMHRNTDLWSYGVIAYQLFTGELPFNTGSFSATSPQGRVELFRQINSGELPEAINRVPAPWNGLIRKLLVVDPHKRLRNCAAVKEYLLSSGEDDVLNNHEEPDIIDNTNDDVVVDNIISEPVSDEPINAGRNSHPKNKDNSVDNEDKHLRNTPKRNVAKKSSKDIGSPTNRQSEPNSSPGFRTDNNPDTPDYLKALESDKKKFHLGIKGYMAVISVLFFLIGMALYFVTTSSDLSTDSVAENETLTNVVDVESPEIVIGENYVEPNINMTMVYIPAGTFTMGASAEQVAPDSNEKPTHSVTLSAYYISATEITQLQWKTVMGSTIIDMNKKSDWSGIKGVGNDMAMYHISWNDAMEFCAKLSELTGRKYTLPTEAQWEYAARGGKSGGTMYSGSAHIEDVAWYDTNSERKVQLVAQKQPNSLGLYDMSGNVWEWCYDWYSDYTSAKLNNPTGSDTGTRRVLRGGSFDHNNAFSRVSARAKNVPTYRNYCYGFRIVEIIE